MVAGCAFGPEGCPTFRPPRGRVDGGLFAMDQDRAISAFLCLPQVGKFQVLECRLPSLVGSHRDQINPNRFLTVHRSVAGALRRLIRHRTYRPLPRPDQDPVQFSGRRQQIHLCRKGPEHQSVAVSRPYRRTTDDCMTRRVDAL